jgi:hypothetical protein
MAKQMSEILDMPESEWMPFPGGELEGERPQRLCPACRQRSGQRSRQSVQLAARVTESAGARRPLCFQCYRLELERERTIEAAGTLHTASDGRFQEGLPFEPVNQARLSTLKMERAAARTVLSTGVGRFADRRRRAQIAARHALQAISAGLKRHQATHPVRDQLLADAVLATELQLPESWLPFVISR